MQDQRQADWVIVQISIEYNLMVAILCQSKTYIHHSYLLNNQQIWETRKNEEMDI